MTRLFENAAFEDERVAKRTMPARRRPLKTADRWRPVTMALYILGFAALTSLGAMAQQNESEPKPQEASPATAPSPKDATSPRLATWKLSLAARLAKGQRYPAQARGAQGVADLAFTLDRNGKLVSSRIVKSSGSPILDAEALDLIKRAAPLPPPPADIADTDLSFTVPIRFSAH